MIKIIFAIKNLNSNIGGAERVFSRLVSLLHSKGYKITVITFDKKNTNSFYKLDGNIKRIYISIGDSTKKTNFREFVQRLIKLRKIISSEKPDLIIGFMSSMFIPLAFSNIGKKIPIIASEHIVIDHYKRKPIEFLLLILSSFYIKRFTVLSSSIKKNFPYLIAKKMTIITNPISKKKTIFPNNIYKKRKIILNIGRLVPQKDHKTLIKAFSLVYKSFPEWDLHIYGEGFLKKKIEDQISFLGLSSRIFLKGVVRDIDSKYASADIFINSSRYESFGLVVAEAMSHQLPCLVFADCPGTNELISNNKTGFLIENKGNRANSLAKGLMPILADSNLRKRIGKAGNELINSKYAEENVINLWEKLFYDILKKK